MGRPFKIFLEESGTIYCCQGCKTHLSLRESLVSSSFRGRTGQAMLFEEVVNVSEGSVEERMMTTGLHTIADVYCNDCTTNLGWRYHEAREESQKYKQGKYILEKALVEKLHVAQMPNSICEDSDDAFNTVQSLDGSSSSSSSSGSGSSGTTNASTTGSTSSASSSSSGSVDMGTISPTLASIVFDVASLQSFVRDRE
eukprot:Filipodium_phascolosomae@DN3108_c0_g1_i1.p1